MKKAKSYKIILLITAFVMSIVAAFAMMSLNSAKAISVLPSAYFSWGKNIKTTAVFDEENSSAIFTLKENDTIEIKNTVAVNDFFLGYEMENVASIKLTTTANSYIANGNKNVDGKFDTAIDNTVLVNSDGTAKLNDDIDLPSGASSGEREIYMNVDDNGYYKASVDGLNYSAYEDNPYYRVKTSNEYFKLTGKVKIEITLADVTKSAVFKIKSLSQKASDESYKQTFVVTDGAFTEAKPIICLTDKTKVADGKAVIYNEITKINYNVYSFLNGIKKSNTKVTAPAGIWVNESENGEVHFTTDLDEAKKQFSIINKSSGVDYLTVRLNVLDEADETEKPYYTSTPNQDALEAFKSALKSEYVADDKGTEDTADDVYVSLGTSIEIPSLEDFVSDDYTSYSSLKTEVHYAKPSSTSFSTKSDMKISLDEVGLYRFFVLFKDVDGNIMNETDFIEEDEETGELKIKNSNYVFSFYVEDNAPIVITPAAQQGKGYKDTTYTASRFVIDAGGCNISYKLYYNSDINAVNSSEGWVEIPSASSVTDTEYDKDGYTYDDVKNIAYNGSLTFTPDKVGSYKIVCTAVSKTTARESSATSKIIRIVDEPTIVEPPSEWLQNNVWSVVFLSIGTLCLIGIIILLCIKPKENKDE